MKLTILLPVYNDNESLNEVLVRIVRISESYTDLDLFFLIVDDASTNLISLPSTFRSNFEVIKLRTNLGHQKAISIGLCHIFDTRETEHCIIMDCDGEDRPEDIKHLIDYALMNNSKVVVASRKSRYDSSFFLLFYKMYKGIFKFMTGKTIDFGNFMIIDSSTIKLLVHETSLWNSLPATILNLNLDADRVGLDRGQRLYGKSRMNFYSLVNHGLSSLSVFIGQIFVRLLFLILFILINLNSFALFFLNTFQLLALNLSIIGFLVFYTLNYLFHLRNNSNRYDTPIEIYRTHIW
jgi:hypothetical protein